MGKGDEPAGGSPNASEAAFAALEMREERRKASKARQALLLSGTSEISDAKVHPARDGRKEVVPRVINSSSKQFRGRFVLINVFSPD